MIIKYAPVLQVSITKLTDIYHDPHSHLDEMVSILENDAVLSKNVLNCINGPLYGAQKKLISISEAIEYFGIATVCGISLSFAIKYNSV